MNIENERLPENHLRRNREELELEIIPIRLMQQDPESFVVPKSTAFVNLNNEFSQNDVILNDHAFFGLNVGVTKYEWPVVQPNIFIIMAQVDQLIELNNERKFGNAEETKIRRKIKEKKPSNKPLSPEICRNILKDCDAKIKRSIIYETHGVSKAQVDYLLLKRTIGRDICIGKIGRPQKWRIEYTQHIETLLTPLRPESAMYFTVKDMIRSLTNSFPDGKFTRETVRRHLRKAKFSFKNTKTPVLCRDIERRLDKRQEFVVKLVDLWIQG